MYFPYLRGKQFELIALRELALLPLDPNKIVPIVEPVKQGLKTVSTALKALKPLNVRIQLIVNPQVGELVGRTAEILAFIDEQITHGVDNSIPTFIIQSDNDVSLVENTIRTKGYDASGYALVHLAPVRRLDDLSNLTKTSVCTIPFILTMYLHSVVNLIINQF